MTHISNQQLPAMPVRGSCMERSPATPIWRPRGGASAEERLHHLTVSVPSGVVERSPALLVVSCLQEGCCCVSSSTEEQQLHQIVASVLRGYVQRGPTLFVLHL